MAPRILSLSMEVNVQHCPGYFTSEKSPWCPLDGKPNGPQNRSGRCREEENLLPLTVIELQFFSRLVHSPVAVDANIDVYHNIRFCSRTGLDRRTTIS